MYCRQTFPYLVTEGLPVTRAQLPRRPGGPHFRLTVHHLDAASGLQIPFACVKGERRWIIGAGFKLTGRLGRTAWCCLRLELMKKKVGLRMVGIILQHAPHVGLRVLGASQVAKELRNVQTNRGMPGRTFEG